MGLFDPFWGVKMTKIWIDIINPSDALFFNSVIKRLSEYETRVTMRNRAETVDLCRSFGINGTVVGTNYHSPLAKISAIFSRTVDLVFSAPKFDVSISFENSIAEAVSRARRKPSILFCDNDLKFLQKKSLFQDLETKVKSFADHIIIPSVCFDNFCEVFDESKLITYDGCKEDIYIADYVPDPYFLDKIPFGNFVVVRPEALESFYVKESKSIVYDLLKAFEKEGINVIYLPREEGDLKYAKDCVFYRPDKPLNGLDLCYYADAVLTGSGTLAREAACMGTTSVSFFPSCSLLSGDQHLVNIGKVFHSRDPSDIVNYVLSNINHSKANDISRCVNVNKKVMNLTSKILSSM